MLTFQRKRTTKSTGAKIFIKKYLQEEILARKLNLIEIL